MKERPPSIFTALFLLAWFGFNAFLVIRTLFMGRFRWGSHRTGIETVSPDNHPYFYGGWLSFWGVVCLSMGYLGVKELSGYLRERKSR